MENYWLLKAETVNVTKINGATQVFFMKDDFFLVNFIMVQLNYRIHAKIGIE